MPGLENGVSLPTMPAKGKATMSPSHPLDPLTVSEMDLVRDVVVQARGNSPLIFRAIFTEEPLKAELVKYLQAEAAGDVSAAARPSRQARAQYDVVNSDRTRNYTESVIDLQTLTEVVHRVVEKQHQPYITIEEFKTFDTCCEKSDMWREAIANFQLPEGFEVMIDPWPYGGPDVGEVAPRYMQGLCFAVDKRNGNPDSNHYGYPLPLVPIMDVHKDEIIRVDRLATGGKGDGLDFQSHPRNILEHCKAAEYVPELLDIPMRTDMKPINVTQPEGASFTVTNETLINWQKWQFRVGFTPRECAVLHDIQYEGRPIMYRLSLSEMTVPYGDPRPPFHRKQAFDFGDAGAGRAANNLSLGCDCLGAIKYLDAVLCDPEGKPTISKNVVCIHEQDNGIGWKHTNFRTNRAVVTRYRELVIQYIITLANYEYIFAYKFDQAGGITIETRATGIVSVVHIDKDKTSPYGNIVSPGALAQNHQHIFAVRVDPAIDSYTSNTILMEESIPMPMDPDTNPHGNGYSVVTTPITKSTSLDASPFTNRVIKLAHPSIKNPISGKPISYKFTPSPTQLLLAHPSSVVASRAKFAAHHVWVTEYRDRELFAGGEFTNQSTREIDGVADACARNDDLSGEGKDPVVWAVYGLTHNPRVEDWPIMPMEKIELHFRPADFFDRNPALDVPSQKNNSSVLVDGERESCCTTHVPGESDGAASAATNGGGEENAMAHMQGTGSIAVNGNGTH